MLAGVGLEILAAGVHRHYTNAIPFVWLPFGPHENCRVMAASLAYLGKLWIIEDVG